MKKGLIVVILLVAGALFLYVYSGKSQRSAAPAFNSKKITPEKKPRTVSAESSSGFVDAHSSTAEDIKELLPVKETAKNPSNDAIHKKEPSIQAEDRLKAVPVMEDILGKIAQPSNLGEHVTPMTTKIKDEAVPPGKEIVRSAGKEAFMIAQEPSGEVEKVTEGEPVAEEIITPEDKPDIIQEEKKVPIAREEVKQPITDRTLVGEETGVVEGKTETLPAGGLIIIPGETAAPAPIELPSVGTGNIVPEQPKDLPSAEIGTDVPVLHPEKAADTEVGIPAVGEATMKMEKTEPFPGEMIKKGTNSRIAIFPFENLSDNRDAFSHVLPMLIKKMKNKGFEVVDEDTLIRFLCTERVRSTGYVSRALADKIRTRFNVSAILTGAIISFSNEDIPQFGIVARMIDSSAGTILWADYSAATGEDFIAILELGRLKSIFSLMPKVIDTLFASLKTQELHREITHLQRIAVMPFKNNSDFNNAGIIATYMFIIEMLKSQQFIPIEHGDTRDIIIKLGIRRKGDIGYENIGALAKELKASGILVGVVDNYSDGADGSRPPKVGITARLVDGRNNKIVWYNSNQLSGEENIIALDWGRIRSVHTVAYKAVSGLVKEMSKKKWRD